MGTLCLGPVNIYPNIEPGPDHSVLTCLWCSDTFSSFDLLESHLDAKIRNRPSDCDPHLQHIEEFRINQGKIRRQAREILSKRSDVSDVRFGDGELEARQVAGRRMNTDRQETGTDGQEAGEEEQIDEDQLGDMEEELDE